jgi:polar amino acid transport system permease protein
MHIMSLYKHLKYSALFAISLLLAGCGRTESILYSIDDLNGTHIAVLDHSVNDQDFDKLFPESKEVHFKSSSEFLLALAIGKCDAGIVDKEMGKILLDKNEEYQILTYPELQNDTTFVITHNRILPGRNMMGDNEHIVIESLNRIHRSIISNEYWKLILKGLYATVAIFILGILMAFILALLMTGMNGNRYLKYISKPISYFIKKIHDVPSVVLIFFFYYFVFAAVHVSGILVCAIALGVYTSGSLMTIFRVNLDQIDKNQHSAAEMLGLTGWKKYRYVILPQAVKPMLPFIASETKVLLRATTYAGYISELDLVKVTEIIRNQTYDVLIPLLLVSIIFLIISHFIVEGLSAIYNKAFKI